MKKIVLLLVPYLLGSSIMYTMDISRTSKKLSSPKKPADPIYADIQDDTLRTQVAQMSPQETQKELKYLGKFYTNANKNQKVYQKECKKK